jgi:phosphoglycolate phosphatase-like HAD superfamily hydrolase
MHLFIFDYDGTLTTLADPVAFVKALKQRHPDSCVLLHTGALPMTIQEHTPGLLEAVDHILGKPCVLSDYVRDKPFSHLIIVDDEPLIRSALTRMFRNFDRPVQILTPDALSGLIGGSSTLEEPQ